MGVDSGFEQPRIQNRKGNQLHLRDTHNRAAMFSQALKFLRKRFLLMVLLGVHLPFLYAYLSSLWQLTHYQFFPFAISAFVMLFASRRSGDKERWTWLSWLLIVVDLACLGFQAYIYSPLVATVGLVACSIAWCSANRDAGYSRRLTYLGLLPFLVIRLPLNYDEQVIQWLQRITTSIASKSLDRLGMLHCREGNVLQFPGKRFMVAEACSGVQSLFTILFIAALVICLRRRSVIHGALLLASGVIFAGIMNSLRVISIAVAWEAFKTDLSVGTPHETVGYICLALAALLLMSADAFLGFLSDPVPDVPRPGAVGMFLNPLIFLWNNLVSVVTLSTNRNSDSSLAAAVKRGAKDQSDSEVRLYPGVSELIKPGNWFHFTLGWAESWLFSRTYRQLLAGLPFVCVAIAGTLLVWWLRHSSLEPLLAKYEAGFNSAVKGKEVERQEIYLRALGNLRSSEPQYRFRLALFMLKQGRNDEGLAEILRLAPNNGLGYVEARMWLVKQARTPNALIRLSTDEIKAQLKAVLLQMPRNDEAHLLLAQLYAQLGDWRLAEQHLAEVARLNPEQNLLLARLKSQLNRNPDEVKEIAGKAITALTQKLGSEKDDAATRIALAEALSVAGQNREAREILESGLQQKDDPLLRKAVSDFDLMLTDRRLNESALNRDACIPVTLKALDRDPSNLAGVQLLTRLHSMGAKLPSDSLKASEEYWQKKVDEKTDDITPRLVLSQLLKISGKPSDAAAALRPVVNTHPELRLDFARLLLQSNAADESNEMLESLIAESRCKLAEKPDDIQAITQLVETQLLQGRADEVRTFLASRSAEPTKKRVPESPELVPFFGQACIDCFDTLSGYKSDTRLLANWNGVPANSKVSAEPKVLLEMLADAFACPTTSNQAIDRLSRLSLSTHPAAGGAEDMIRQLRLEGTYGSQVLNMLGMHALMMHRYDKARAYLDQANIQTRGRDPMILNNLATALVRSDSDSYDRALQLADETLKLLPDHPDALSTRGEVYIALKRWPEAVADLTEAIKLRKDSPELHRLLEKTYIGLADVQMAEDHRKRATELEAAQQTR